MATLLKSTQARFLIIIATVLLILIVGQIIVHQRISLQAADAEIINTSGKQRILSQQIAKLGLLMARTDKLFDTQDQKVSQYLNELLTEFKSNHTNLNQQESKLHVPALNSLYSKTTPSYQSIIQLVQRLQQANDLLSRRVVSDSLNLKAEEFLIHMEFIVDESEKIAVSRIDDLRAVEMKLAGIAIVILMLEFIFLVFPLFKENKDLSALILELKESKAKVIAKDEEKRKVEEILSKTNEVARIGTWEVDNVKGIISWSKVTREIHEVPEDYTPELSTAINFFKEGASRTAIEKAVEEAMEKGTPYDLELELVTAKGNNVWARAIGKAEFENNQCTRLYGVFQDISAIKASQKALHATNAEMSAILNAGPTSIITTDLNGIITNFNKGAEDLLKYTATEIVGIQTPAIFHLEEEVIERGLQLSEEFGREIEGFDVFVEHAKQDTFESRNWTYVRKNGSKIQVQLVVTALKDENQEICGYIGIATDISDMVEQQSKLLAAKNDLKELSERLTFQNQQLASFAHIASHNLRSPISNLSSLLNLYNMSEGEEEKSNIFGHFEKVIGHLTDTLEVLVESIKIKEDLNQRIETISFEEIFNKTKDMLVDEVLHTDAKISCDFSQAPKVSYNKLYLESIMMNLLTNAIKYRSPERKPEISLITRVEDGKISLEVHDNGLGIDLEKHNQKLFGLNKTFHRNPEAKGVGLYITKTQVESMNGTISANSKVNQGSTFTVKF
ncbi:PAS domain S-box-containing protein [Reichenbachiella faecimaris]|uniref:histidine kinase n=1 Tax=Reichenbachiella faecimaris TaxID=692418 RepID=A0A1W2GPK4_REIFA|nr:ATP-binding protein [Reichenbachiella faecimaris]SMD38206.1 PAS domain S-box-containing protein [Reichenbachiella faecimaris]